MQRLHCVGVCQLDDRVACLLMLKRGTATLHCIELDAGTAIFVSPLYEHDLALVPSATKLSAEAKKQMALVDCDTLEQVLEWQAWSARLAENLTPLMLMRQLNALLSRTLFIQSAHCEPAGRVDLLHQLYAPRARSTAFCSSEPLLRSYAQLREQADRDRPKRQPLGTAFWQAMEKRDEQLLTDSINLLFAYARKDAVYPTMRDVAALLLAWKLPCARYVAHKIAEMPEIHRLHLLTRRKGDSAHPLARSLAFAQLNCGLNNAAAECTALIAHLWHLMSELDEEPVPSKSNYRQLVHACLLRGGVQRLLDALYDKLPSLRERCVAVRRRVLVHFLLPLLVANLEHHLTAKSHQTRSTLECLTTRTIYLAYAHLFREDETEARRDCEQQFFALDHHDDARPPGTHLFEFDLEDFNQALSTLHQLLMDDNEQPPWRTQYKWRARYTEQAPLLKTTLFYVETHPVLLQTEAKITAHYERHIFSAALSVLVRSADEPLDELWSASDPDQQYRLLLFDPVEMRHGRDLEAMRELALADLYDTALLREQTTAHFFRARLQQAFASELADQEWYEELYYETPGFRSVDTRALRGTVIVPDAHLLGSNDLLALLRWCTTHRQTVRRVLMCGSADLAPLSQHGQPFTDLLMRVDSARIRRQAFDEERRTRLFNDLLAAWTVHVWPATNKLARARFVHDLDWTQRPALYVLPGDTMGALEEFLTAIHGNTRIALQYLQGEKPPAIALKSCDKHTLRGNGCARLAICPLRVDALAQHRRFSVECELFLVAWPDLLKFTRNQQQLLLCQLERLIVLACPVEDAAQALRDAMARDKRPTLRYTQSSMK